MSNNEQMAIVRFQTWLSIQPHISKPIRVEEMWPFAWESEASHKRSSKIDMDFYKQLKEQIKDW